MDGGGMSMDAPERIELMPEWIGQYRASIKSPFAVAYVPEASLTAAQSEYADLDAAFKRVEANRDALAEDLDAAQARIAELEAALSLRTGADHDPDCKAHRDRSCNCGHDQARRALEAKP